MTTDAPANEVSGRQREPEALAQPAHTATLSVSYPTPASASHVARSLTPEVGRVPDDRASASVTHEGETVTVTVQARDLVALRAGTTSWSRLLAVAEDVAGVGTAGDAGSDQQRE